VQKTLAEKAIWEGLGKELQSAGDVAGAARKARQSEGIAIEGTGVMRGALADKWAAENPSKNAAIEGMSTGGAVEKALGKSWVEAMGKIKDLQKRAKGGPVKAGKPYLVGEEGPEIVVPKEDGEVIPNDKLRKKSRKALRKMLSKR
jgi:hypothetical protein